MRLSIIAVAAVLSMTAGCNKKSPEHAGTAASSAEHAGKTADGKPAEHGGKSAEHAGKTAEHAGKSAEHAGKSTEHAGKSTEHAGKTAEHGGTPAATPAATPMATFNADQIKAAMNEHIKAETTKGAGVLKIKDEKTSENLTLEFVKIHDPVRVIEGKGYFACTDFKPKGDKMGKLYDLDFWLKPDASGKLAVYDTKIHKHPEQGADKKWTKKERYTFMNDNPVDVK